MRGGSYSYNCGLGSRVTQANEEAVKRVKEAAEVRLARITNGAEPTVRNGTTVLPEYQEKSKT